MKLVLSLFLALSGFAASAHQFSCRPYTRDNAVRLNKLLYTKTIRQLYMGAHPFEYDKHTRTLVFQSQKEAATYCVLKGSFTVCGIFDRHARFDINSGGVALITPQTDELRPIGSIALNCERKAEEKK